MSPLLETDAYPHDPSAKSGIEHLQTHLSHVFLTRDYVYKLRKPVAFDFVDFGSLEARRQDCLDEIRLNRRTSPDVYLGVAALAWRGSGVIVDPVCDPDSTSPPAPPAELVTVMRRLPAGGDALSLLERGALSEEQCAGIARAVASFHTSHRVDMAVGADGWRAVVRAPVQQSMRSITAMEDVPDRALLRGLEWRLREFEARHEARFARRLQGGRGVEGHGDLHLQHLWFDRDGSLQIIDCLEFSKCLRTNDAAADLAFLTMDLRYRGRGDLAECVLGAYAEAADDYDLFPLLPYFESYRALVRAKVALLATADPALAAPQREAARQSGTQHLELAYRVLEPPPQGTVIAMTGSVGTGKSTVARQLAAVTGAISLSSDALRRRVLGAERGTSLRATWNEGAYQPAQRDAVYDALRERAAEVVRSGRVAILDASHATRAQRDATWQWAVGEALRPWLVHTTCERQLTRARLVARARAAAENSDAGPEHLDASRRGYEAPAEWPSDRRVEIDTGDPDAGDGIRGLWRRFLASRFG